MTSFIRTAVCLLMLFLSACGTLEVSLDRTPTPGQNPTAAIAALEQQNAELATQVATLSPPTPTIMPAPQPTPQDVLGGGTVSDGPFIFDLRLFRDQGLSRNPVATSLYSDLEGIGTWMYWFYNGADAIGPVQTYWGTLPQADQLLQETYPSLLHGSSGGRNGGILLQGDSFIAGDSRPGHRVQVALKVVSPGGEYGAVLSFTLKQGANGLQPTDISVDVLRSVVAPTP